ncbi:hypothetical protein [Streptomyces sp. CB02460]|nr:hypothetical protein [Streptomyces sp. CB02460]
MTGPIIGRQAADRGPVVRRALTGKVFPSQSEATTVDAWTTGPG